jgi:hypothetical protein
MKPQAKIKPNLKVKREKGKLIQGSKPHHKGMITKLDK